MLSPKERQELVETIHTSPTQLVLAVAGGGHAVITDLLGVAGASATMLEAIVPYSATSLAELIAEHRPEGSDAAAVSASTAEAMARACLIRAARLAPDATHLLGVACTATIATNREKRGEHRGHIHIVGSADSIAVAALVPLAKGTQTRVDEDQSIADEVLIRVANSVLPPPR